MSINSKLAILEKILSKKEGDNFMTYTYEQILESKKNEKEFYQKLEDIGLIEVEKLFYKQFPVGTPITLEGLMVKEWIDEQKEK